MDPIPAAPSGADLKRLLLSDLAEARHVLEFGPVARDQAVHKARRRLKRARTLLWLLRPLAGLDREHRLEPVKAAFKRLSGARDADAMLAAGRWLAARADDAVAPVAATLVARLEQAAAAAHAEAMPLPGILSNLRIAEADAASLPETFDGARLFETGLVAIYRRGRACFRDVHEGAKPVVLHEWRKQVKHRLHLTQICDTNQPAIRAQLKDLDRLAEYLGEGNDFANLDAWIDAHVAAIGQQDDVDALRHLIARRRRKLQRRAVELGEELYGERTRQFEAGLSSMLPAVSGGDGQRRSA